jgi:hypothetical protein
VNSDDPKRERCFWFRFWAKKAGAATVKGRWQVSLIDLLTVVKEVNSTFVRFDLVDLRDGTLIRRDYKKQPLPIWLSDEMLRGMVMATSKIPEVDQYERNRRKLIKDKGE